MALRSQVRSAIADAGRTQKWVAGQLGISEKHLSRMLTGRIPLTLKWTQEIARITGHTLHVHLTPNRVER